MVCVFNKIASKYLAMESEPAKRSTHKAPFLPAPPLDVFDVADEQSTSCSCSCPTGKMSENEKQRETNGETKRETKGETKRETKREQDIGENDENDEKDAEL